MVGMIKSRGDKIFDACNYVLMTVLAICFLYPFWHCLALSLGDVQYSTTLGLKLFPPKVTFANYAFVLKDASIATGYKNTLIRTVIGTVFTVMTNYLAAYGIARRDLPFKKAISFYFLVTMFFGGGMIPSYINMRTLGLINSRWALILPGMASCYNILIARNFISALPQDLEEAATIDGAHPMRVLFQIMLPLSMPIISVLALWSAVGHWNAWFDALIYTPADSMMVLQQVLRRMLIVQPDVMAATMITAAETTTETIKAATIMVSIIPIICIYPFLQKFFEKGIMIGAVKG